MERIIVQPKVRTIGDDLSLITYQKGALRLARARRTAFWLALALGCCLIVLTILWAK